MEESTGPPNAAAPETLASSIRQELLSEIRVEVSSTMGEVCTLLNSQGHSLRRFPGTDDDDLEYFDWDWENDPDGASAGLRIYVSLDSEVRIQGSRSAFDTP
jgi:hypothetical protein